MNGYKILATGISNLTDARFFAAWEADWLAFDLDPASETYVSPARIAAIQEWIVGPDFAGVTGIQPASDMLRLCDDLDLKMIIAPMFIPIETHKELSAILPVFREIVVEPYSTEESLEGFLESFAPWTACFVFNLSKNGILPEALEQGRPVSGAWLSAICAQYPVLLQMDLNPSTLKDVLHSVQPAGICLTGGAEEKTGYKSFDELDELLETLREL